VGEGKRERRRDLGLPALVGIGGTLICLFLWGLLVADRHEQILAGAADTASETREAIEVGLEHQVETLRGLQDLWRSFGLRPIDEWKANVGQRIDRAPGLHTVAWVDLDEPGARVAVGLERSAADVEFDEEKARAHSNAPHVEGPEREASGAVQYRIFLPVRTPGDHAGVLVGRFLAEPFLASVLSARARGYALSVFWGDEVIYSRGTPSSDPRHEWWRIEETVALPLGGEWRVVHRPTPQFAALRLTPLPHYLLGAGIVLSLVLALAAYQLRLIVRQARTLEASNRSLEQRGAELEARVAERTEALREAVTELEAFNYSVSHDLRSPLGAILNFTAILEEDYRNRLGEEGAAIIARIHRSASRATDLLEDLLRLSRAGRAALTIERIDMAKLARETFAQVCAYEQRNDLEFVVDPLPETWGDHNLLGAVFANLFSNALKYSRSCEKPRITVSGRIENDESVYEVEDNGRGFDMRYVEKMFGLFERLHTGDDVEGTGVGLAMAARIVKRHGGRLWAEGRLGEGACFSFALPIRETP